MVDDGGGNIAAGPTGPTRAQPQIGILTIQKKRIVESAGCGEHGLAVNGRRPTCQQRFVRLREILRRLAVPALLAGPVGGDQHSRRVERVLHAEQPNLRGGRTGLRMAIERGHHFIQPFRLGRRIVVNDGYEFSRSLARGQVHRRAETDVSSGMENGNARARSFVWPVLFHAPATAVVDNHNAKIPIRLPVQTRDAFPQSMVGGKRGNDDGDPVRLQISIVRRAGAVHVTLL